MLLTLADQYYIKALEAYHYNLEEVVENLQYALSYDQEHAGANYLMGRLFLEQFQKFDQAEAYFQASLESDPTNIDTCERLSWLFIRTRRFDEALKLIHYGSALPGALKPDFIRLEALIYELQKDYIKAKELLNEAIEESYDSRYISFLEKEKARVNKKAKKYLKDKKEEVG